MAADVRTVSVRTSDVPRRDGSPDRLARRPGACAEAAVAWAASHTRDSAAMAFGLLEALLHKGLPDFRAFFF